MQETFAKPEERFIAISTGRQEPDSGLSFAVHTEFTSQHTPQCKYTNPIILIKLPTNLDQHWLLSAREIAILSSFGDAFL